MKVIENLFWLSNKFKKKKLISIIIFFPFLYKFKVTHVVRSFATSKEKLGLSIKSTKRLHTEVCAKSFWLIKLNASLSVLNFLLLTVTLPCDQCKRIFHNAWFLQKHKQLVHSGERRMFKCSREGCQKSYTKNFNLQNHILVFHEGKRDFICPFAGCGKAFAMKVSISLYYGGVS